MPIRSAAKVDRADCAYWEAKIRLMIDANPNVELAGEIGKADKARFLGGAAAMLLPTDGPDPFGLVVIEAHGMHHAGGGLSLRIGSGGH
jgi:hypothetical protein